MVNSNFVIQGCLYCQARGASRAPVTRHAYTQLVTSDVAVESAEPTFATPSATAAAPAAGRPFTTEAGRWNAEVLHAETLIRAGLERVSPSASLTESGPCLSTAQGYASAIDRAARRLPGAWLSGVLVGDLSPTASLLDGETWFCGSAPTAAALPLDCARHAHAVLERLVRQDGAVAMLPYALDPIAHEYRRDVVNKGSGGATRSARKATGSFFTPADVAGHIVELALAGVDLRSGGMRVLDPAVGTGVFLRAAFAALVNRGLDPDAAIGSVFGIDIDERCVDMAALVLLVDYARAGGRLSIRADETWRSIRSTLIAADALTTLSGRPADATLFQEPSYDVDWLKAPFDVIVGNPPYARIGTRPDLADLRARYRSLEKASTSSDVFPAFAELLCGNLATNGAGSMVLPMSVGYSTTQQLRHLRLAAQEAGGAWSFEFFDRTPDALFGDDVKQRTAIVTRRSARSYSIRTSPVLRWTSRNRSTLFERIPLIELGEFDIVAGVPKLGSVDQAEAFRALRACNARIEDDLAACSRVVPPVTIRDSATVFVAGTAYNWLNVYRTADAITRGVDRPTGSPMTALTAASSSHADAVFALLCSRVAYWLWRVETDVFHVPASWIRALPLSLSVFDERRSKTLAELGRALWASIRDHPVQSFNRGTKTVSYCPHSAPELLDAIDAEIVDRYGLPGSFGVEIATFVRGLATAGRAPNAEHGLRRALASWRED